VPLTRRGGRLRRLRRRERRHRRTRGEVLLRDVARVEDGFRERESIARYNGAEAVGLLVFKDAGDANTVRVAERWRRCWSSSAPSTRRWRWRWR
jgi:multidrug efflux pump subunit AcrB